MVLLTHAGDDTGRLFLVLQPGMIVVFENDPGVESAQTFLDIRERVSDAGNEEGMLGLAFDPAYAENGYFYVYYSASRPRRSVVSRFSGQPRRPQPGGTLARSSSSWKWSSPTATTTGATSCSDPTACSTSALGTAARPAIRRATGRTNPPSWAASCASTLARLDSLGTYAVPG